MRTSIQYCFASLCLCVASLLTGCASSGGEFGGPVPTYYAVSVQGTVRSGQQPVSGAHVYLMEMNNVGYDAASVSLLSGTATGNADSVGAYALTDSNGNFSLPSTYVCGGQYEAYVYVLGGNAGGGANTGIGMMAVLGGCPQAGVTPTENVVVNEVTTIAAAYALAGFGSDPTHISASNNTLARTGVLNAVNNAGNLANIATGEALTLTVAGNGVVPVETVHTLANLLASCIRSTGPASAACSTLFANAKSSANGVAPSDTATAAMNIAHNPGLGVTPLYALAGTTSVFTPSLPIQPNDFTIGINYSGGGLNGPYAVAIDANGDAWFANLNTSSITKLSANGTPLSPATGYTNGNPVGPVGITIDLSGNAWIVNAVTSSLTKYAASGALLSPSPGYLGGGLSVPQGIATDAVGNIWVANYFNSVSKFSNGGTPISPATGFTGGGIRSPVGVAIDASGAVWIPNTTGSPTSVTKLSNAGAPMSPTTGYTGGGLNNPFSIAIDSGGNAWIANFSGNSVTKMSNSGVPLSPSTGFTGGGLSLPFSIAVDGGGHVWVANAGAFSVTELANDGTMISPATGYTGGTLNGPQAIAVDGSGDVWVANGSDITVTELIGAATPVITPTVSGIQNNTVATRP
jgi:hypothetical protein